MSVSKIRREAPDVVFAQVREDAAVELHAVSLCPPPATAFCIGSGGCTAFSLLTAHPRELIALDINPAQVYLLQLKKVAFEQLSYGEMLNAMATDARETYALLRPALGPQARAFWDEHVDLLAHGLNGCGLIERKLGVAMRVFRLLVHSRSLIRTMLRQPDLRAQVRYYRARWNTWRWRLALRLGLSRPALRRAYGADFVAAVPADFPALMERRMERVFTRFPASDNAYLWQTFLGAYPPTQDGLPPYLRREHFDTVRAGMARTTLVAADAAGWLAAQPAGSIDFFGLSNILDATSPGYALQLWDAVARSGKPGAIVCLRSIFPPRPGLLPDNAPLHLDPELSARLQAIDRSPFATYISALRVKRSAH